jgi:hypothetical protein
MGQIVAAGKQRKLLYYNDFYASRVFLKKKRSAFPEAKDGFFGPGTGSELRVGKGGEKTVDDGPKI